MLSALPSRPRKALRPADADALVSFVRAARPLAAAMVSAIGTDPDRLTAHWRAEVALVAAAPGLGGRLASAAQGLVAGAAQGTLVVALALAAGVTSTREHARLTAVAVLDRRLPDGWEPRPLDQEDDDVRAAAAQPEQAGLLRGLPGRLMSLGRVLNTGRRLVGGRQEGRLWHRTVALVPVAGAAGALLGERHALRGVSERTRRELAGRT